jgi:succinylglutamic semialdehyde dehydrogenase
MASLFIDGVWREGRGETFSSVDPAKGEAVWSGAAADALDTEDALRAAHKAFPAWAATPLEERIALARAYGERLKARAEDIARDIARETGKPLWEARTEVAGMVGKVEVSIRAQAERAGSRAAEAAFGRSVLRHRPHGVMAVLGPFNFPGHLPNGHIVPALLAGDTVVFKPSEETPLTGANLARAWKEAGLPSGVLNLVQGGRDTGASLIAGKIDGLLFTGSAGAGAHFRRVFVDRPEVILALELGGNNPLIAWDGDPVAAASVIAQSAFITAGQRCSCARRLVLPRGPRGDAILQALLALAARLTVGEWDSQDPRFMGALISVAAADRVRAAVAALVGQGARVLFAGEVPADLSPAFVAPTILDVTEITVADEEIFGPVLQVIRVDDFEAAIVRANDTAYGLAAGLITEDDALWEAFLDRSRAGVVNRNRPTTGAAATLPFGGLGASGNHRSSAYYAADYCAYPVASFEADRLVDQTTDIMGLAAPGQARR